MRSVLSNLRLGVFFGACAVAFILFSPPFVFAISAAKVSSPFTYHFSVGGTLHETGSMDTSSSPYWWLNSGAVLILESGVGMTAQGSLPLLNTWRTLYAASNSLDTDGGTHPQNLFRLVSRSQWNNVRMEAAYKITADHFSSSPNRNASNGLLLMSRYHMGGDTLYYAGIRVDGTAVLKKKLNGTYTTLAQKKVFSGTYTEGATVNLLPHNSWVTLRSETVTNANGTVTVRLFMKKQGESGFTKLLEAIDSQSPITGSGYTGIRTDFMDVMFDDVRITAL